MFPSTACKGNITIHPYELFTKEKKKNKKKQQKKKQNISSLRAMIIKILFYLMQL